MTEDNGSRPGDDPELLALMRAFHRLVAEDARLCQVFVKHGVVPDVGGASLLLRLDWMQRARKLMLLAGFEELRARVPGTELSRSAAAPPSPQRSARTRSPTA